MWFINFKQKISTFILYIDIEKKCDHCDTNARCLDGLKCSCNDGYQGDGHICKSRIILGITTVGYDVHHLVNNLKKTSF